MEKGVTMVGMRIFGIATLLALTAIGAWAEDKAGEAKKEEPAKLSAEENVKVGRGMAFQAFGAEQQGVGFNFFLLEKIQEPFRGIDGEKVAAEIEEVGVGGGEATRKDQWSMHVLI